jgi:hypothetical protein
VSGEEAYRKYIEHTLPFLEKSGGEIFFMGKAGKFLIGPTSEMMGCCYAHQAKKR